MEVNFDFTLKSRCETENKKLRFWVKARCFDKAMEVYRNMRRKSCYIDKDLENFMFLKFFKENLSESDKQTLKALAQLI